MWEARGVRKGGAPHVTQLTDFPQVLHTVAACDLLLCSNVLQQLRPALGLQVLALSVLYSIWMKCPLQRQVFTCKNLAIGALRTLAKVIKRTQLIMDSALDRCNQLASSKSSSDAELRRA